MSDDEANLRLLALAAHELRTPANVISGYLRMLQAIGPSPLDEAQRRMLDGAERSCRHLLSQIADLSDIQKLDDRTLPLAQAIFSLFPLLETVLSDLDKAGRDDIHVELRGSVDGASVTGDASRLGRAFGDVTRAVLRGLTPNAVAVAHCRIDSHQGRRSAVIVIAEGPAVDTATRAPEGPFDDMRGGLGLALPLARRIIERHGGRLWSPAGDSARFAALIRLPLA